MRRGEDRVTQFIFIVSLQYDFTEPPPICFAILVESHMQNLTGEGELGEGVAPRHMGQISGVVSVIVTNSATPRLGKAKQSPSPTSKGQ